MLSKHYLEDSVVLVKKAGEVAPAGQDREPSASQVSKPRPLSMSRAAWSSPRPRIARLQEQPSWKVRSLFESLFGGLEVYFEGCEWRAVSLFGSLEVYLTLFFRCAFILDSLQS